MYAFITKYNILYEYQFGFRRKHSTNHAIITLVDRLTKALDSGKMVIGVFLDLKKAFDTVNHSILLKKLYQYGIRGSCLNWIKSYLQNRSQYVYYNKTKSNIEPISCGVPQGSILGPLLFVLYINDIKSISKKLFTLLFADDTSAFIEGDNLHELLNILNEELNSLYDWLCMNRLTINVNKTHYMVFHRARIKDNPTCNVLIHNEPIDHVKHTKFLGVMIDSKLNWSEHIKHISTKVSKGIGIINKAKKYMNRKGLLNLYNSLVYPYLLYCIEVWGKTDNYITEPLFKIQKKIIRLICHVPYYSSTRNLFPLLNILPLSSVYKLRIGLFMYKVHCGLQPDSILKLYQVNNIIHNHNTRQMKHLHTPIGNTSHIYKSFYFQSIQFWNKILSKINIDLTFYQFKKELRKYILASNNL